MLASAGLLTKERAGLLLGLGLICLDRVERRGGKGVPRKGEKGKQEEEEAGGKEGKISHKSGPPNIRKRKRCERPKVCGGGSEDRVEKNVPTAARRKKRLIAKTKGKVERGEAEQPAAVSGDTCEGKAASSAG